MRCRRCKCLSDEVVTAALVRIFGRQFAELPLVATKAGSTGKVAFLIRTVRTFIGSNRPIVWEFSCCVGCLLLLVTAHWLLTARYFVDAQGFCKALILSIERLLGVLNVERLILPAAEGAEGIWVKKFAFSKLSDEEVRLSSGP